MLATEIRNRLLAPTVRSALIGWNLLWATLLASVPVIAVDSAGGLQETALAARSGPRQATMFVALPPEQTGVICRNSYSDPKMWGERYQELAYGAMGTGVTIGDYDNDGRPDLFVVSKTGQSRLFRNLGDWKFEDVTVKAGLARSSGTLEQGLSWMKGLVGGAGAGAEESTTAWTQGATFVDVNNDGWLDLYVCRFAAPNLLYMNQGDGTFKEEAAARGLAITDASSVAAFCDYDRDGWLDVYVQTSMLNATAHPNGQRDYLFHNQGDGTFVNVTEPAGIKGEGMGHSATWWDYNNDGWPDLYVTNDYAAPDCLYRNTRDGTFTNVINDLLPHTPYYSMGSDLGDVNNDGLIDLLVADMAPTTRTKDLRGMAGSRARAQVYSDDTTEAPQFMRSALYLNTGTGRCLEGANLAGFPATDWTWSVRFEDLDNDGRLDLHVTNGMNREYHNADLLDRMMGLENLGDSRRLMQTMPAFAERHLAYRNLGDLRFEEVGAAWGLNQTGVSFGAAFGDLDGDGDLDLVYANYEAGVTVLRNDSDSGHRVIIALRGTASNRFGIGATVRIETAGGVQVRQSVLARGYLSSSEPIVHFGLGEETRINKLTVEWPSGHTQTFTDLPGDRRFTLTEPSGPVRPKEPARPAPGQFADVSQADGLSLTVEDRPEQQANPQPLVPVRFDRRGPALAVGDLNGDQQDDLILGGTAQAPAQIRLGSIGGHFSPAGSLPPPSLDDGPLLIFDADGDGRNDLLQTKASVSRPAGSADYQPVLYLNEGGGAFHPAPAGALPPLPMSTGAVVAADFDRDGRLDVFLGARVLPGKYPLAPRSALLANRGGRFEDVTDTIAPGLREVGMVSSALWSDVDGDGWPDLLVALEWGGVRYFHNEGGRSFKDLSGPAGFAAAGAGWWTSLASADFNGDGRPDYVAGNAGLNTPYRADPLHPALLFYGRFADGSQPQLIEAGYDDDHLHPLRSRNELGARMPSILKRYPKNNEYARATLEEILGADRLATAQRFAAVELRSGVFLSQPDGTYRFEPLPRIAQIAPLQGMVAGDFDGDGHADIYAVQNSFAPIPSIGRFDGGLSQLLGGDGHGHFTPVTPLASGLVVPGDAKALTVLDLDADGWPDFLVSRNNGPTLAWRNRGVPGRHSFRVVLQGPPGNPTAIGARLSLELADGTTQTAEVQAGSGYYSQSTAACFFGYPEGNPPRRLRVCWPAGNTTEHAFESLPGPTISFRAP